MRRIAWIAGVAALLFALFLWASHRDEAIGNAAAQAPSDPAKSALAAPTSITALELPPDRHVAETPIEPTPAPSPIVAQGTIIVLDESGREHAQESGVLTLFLSSQPGKSVDVPVTNGTWDPEATPDVDCFITKIVLGGRVAILEDDRAVMLKAKQPAALRARWLASMMLHVVDAKSGAELDQLRLMRIDQM